MDIFTSLGIKSGIQERRIEFFNYSLIQKYTWPRPRKITWPSPEAVNEGKRRSSAPCILFGFDRTINLISTAIPGTVLAFVITFGGAIYKSDGLELVNPRDSQGFTDHGWPVRYESRAVWSHPRIPDRENGGLRFDRWTEVTTVKEYCWNHLGNVIDDQNLSMEYQHHYRDYFFKYNRENKLSATKCRCQARPDGPTWTLRRPGERLSD